MIHKSTDPSGKSRFKRLDFTDMTVRDKVLRANSSDELDNIFATYGIFD
jgi:type III restriction enzyme